MKDGVGAVRLEGKRPADDDAVRRLTDRIGLGARIIKLGLVQLSRADAPEIT